MSLALGPHQDISRALSLLGSQNIGDAAARLGTALHLLQLDMVLHLLDEPEGCVQVKTPVSHRDISSL